MELAWKSSPESQMWSWWELGPRRNSFTGLGTFLVITAGYATYPTTPVQHLGVQCHHYGLIVQGMHLSGRICIQPTIGCNTAKTGRQIPTRIILNI
jgi:hypothetical protein